MHSVLHRRVGQGNIATGIMRVLVRIAAAKVIVGAIYPISIPLAVCTSYMVRIPVPFTLLPMAGVCLLFYIPYSTHQNAGAPPRNRKTSRFRTHSKHRCAHGDFPGHCSYTRSTKHGICASPSKIILMASRGEDTDRRRKRNHEASDEQACQTTFF